MATVGSLVVDLVANTASFTAGMRNARNEVQSFQQYARNVKLDIGGIEGAGELANGISEAAEQLDRLRGGAGNLGQVSSAFSGAAASAAGMASAIEKVNAALSSMNSLASGAAGLGVGVAAIKSINWIKESGAADVKSSMDAIMAEHTERSQEAWRYRQFRAQALADQTGPLLSEQIAAAGERRRQQAEAAQAFRAPAIAAMDAILNPLKSSSAKAGLGPGGQAAFDMEQVLLGPLREGRIDIQDFREAVARAAAEAENNAKAMRDAADAAESKRNADEVGAKYAGFGLEAIFGGNPGLGLAGLGPDAIRARALASASSRGVVAAPSALEFGSNRAFSAEGTVGREIQKEQLEAQKRTADNTKAAADNLSKLKGAAVFSIKL